MYLPTRNRDNRFINPFFAVRQQPVAQKRRLDLLNSRAHPPINIARSDDAVEVQIAAPGLVKDNIEITLEKNVLTVKAAATEASSLEVGKYISRERGPRDFERTIYLSDDIDAEKITAEYKLGILRVSIPRLEKDKPRTIHVH